MSNQTQVTGDSNIILQDIDSSQINITINDGLSDEIKSQKKQLKQQIDELKQVIDREIQAIVDDTTETDPSSDVRKIIRALKADRCVLFIGPGVALDSELGQSLHEIKFKELSNNSDGEIIYNESDGFFEPPLDSDLEFDLLDYYQDNFPKENIIGKETLTNLAELPFRLIVSSSPDETITDIFRHYDKSHQFQYYEGHGLEDLSPEKDSPLIINALGSITSTGGQFTYTTADFYEYIMNFEFPATVKKEIQQAKHLLFIGFDLRKWHTRLILFMLEMHIKKDKSNRSLLSHIPHEKVKNFLQNQFQVTQIDEKYLEFSQQLSTEARKEGIAINLNQFFFKKQLAKLQGLSIQVSDTKEMSVLYDVENQLANISKKMDGHAK